MVSAKSTTQLYGSTKLLKVGIKVGERELSATREEHETELYTVSKVSQWGNWGLNMLLQKVFF